MSFQCALLRISLWPIVSLQYCIIHCKWHIASSVSYCAISIALIGHHSPLLCHDCFLISHHSCPILSFQLPTLLSVCPTLPFLWHLLLNVPYCVITVPYCAIVCLLKSLQYFFVHPSTIICFHYVQFFCICPIVPLFCHIESSNVIITLYYWGICALLRHHYVPSCHHSSLLCYKWFVLPLTCHIESSLCNIELSLYGIES